MTQRNLNIAHSCDIWLPQTMTWLHSQIQCQPAHVHNHVVCRETTNLNQFAITNLVSADQDNLLLRKLTQHSWRFSKHRQKQLLIKCISKHNASVLHSHFGDHGWGYLNTAHQARVKHVVSFYGFDASRLTKTDPSWHQKYHHLFEEADRFLCEGPALGKCLQELGCPEEKISIHHLGIQLNKIRFKARHWDGHSPIRFLIAGTFVEKKGIPFALEAIGDVATRFPVEITIIGDANNQERSLAEKSVILDKLKQFNLLDKTRLLGFQPYSTLLEAAYSHHFFVSPSVTASDGDTEGGAPVSIIEMAASGLPIISTTHCDIPEVLPEEYHALLAEERNSQGLVKCIESFINNPQLWTELTEKARSRIEYEFDSEKQGTRLAAIYESL